MDCPHLAECSFLSVEFGRFDHQKKQCSDCSANYNLWMCLTCGKLSCSRYANGHALRHYELNNEHKITISTETTSVYCYKCDDEVHQNIYKNNSLEQLRRSIVTSVTEVLESESEGVSINATTANDTRILRSKSQKRSHSKEEDDDDDDDDDELENKQSRKLSMRNKNSQEKKAIGLRNLGNTCFMNAVLQSLNNIHPFSYYIKQLPSFEKLKKNTWKDVRQSRSSKNCDDVLIAEELRKILLGLNCEYDGLGRSSISPESLFLVIWKVVPRFRGYQQQDAHEFLRYMLDRLHMELLLLLPEIPLKDVNIGQKGRASIITCVFGGILQSEVRCLNCAAVSKKQDPFLDLSLDIPDKSLPKHLTSRRSKEPLEQDTPACNIQDCLSSFVQVEELAESEQYYCNNCKNKQRSTKRFWIRRLPNVLCLHLKRFRWINFYRVKLDTDISFPIEFLDMSDFMLHDVRDTRQSCIGSNVYDLAAVIVHHGSGAGCGHYTAFAIHKGRWFHFNDSSVQQVRSATVAKCKPYILFYVRRQLYAAVSSEYCDDCDDDATLRVRGVDVAYVGLRRTVEVRVRVRMPPRHPVPSTRMAKQMSREQSTSDRRERNAPLPKQKSSTSREFQIFRVESNEPSVPVPPPPPPPSPPQARRFRFASRHFRALRSRSVRRRFVDARTRRLWSLRRPRCRRRDDATLAAIVAFRHRLRLRHPSTIDAYLYAVYSRHLDTSPPHHRSPRVSRSFRRPVTRQCVDPSPNHFVPHSSRCVALRSVTLRYVALDLKSNA
ncbi:hypothetical protein V9T40_010511 [Parthenolecanium corni]|uniref:Ubiquitin carboxyl-terminal hydrolase n=1 Tax=Parthenolecanium corni TaxID=536013 RepID=A0AAN9T6A1_9HEMI